MDWNPEEMAERAEAKIANPYVSDIVFNHDWSGCKIKEGRDDWSWDWDAFKVEMETLQQALIGAGVVDAPPPAVLTEDMFARM